MAEEQQEIRRVNWAEVFTFTQIFKGFRMAIHPSKLLLALAAIVLVLAVGWALDGIWGLFNRYANPQEVLAYVSTSPRQFERQLDQWVQSRPERAADLRAAVLNESQGQGRYLGKLRELGASDKFISEYSRQLGKANTGKDARHRDRREFMDDAERRWSRALSEAQSDISTQLSSIDDLIGATISVRKKEVEALEKAQRPAAEKQLEDDRLAAYEAMTRLKVDYQREARDIRGMAVGDAFYTYEWSCVTNAISAVWHGNFVSGMDKYQQLQQKRATPPANAGAPTLDLPTADASDGSGFLFWVLMSVQGICWLFSNHLLWALIFSLVTVAIWAVFGGAIHRVAALHYAREEKISMAQAVRFSVGKFFGFFTAPLIPLAVIVGIGLLLALGGLVGNIPGVGPVIIGVLMILALVFGLVIAFLIVGLTGGMGLMYPTIAVEGSDSFDAFSRSYAYIFARPWRTVFYGLVSLVYGAVCYFFVRAFAYVALFATHTFVRWGLWDGGERIGASDKLPVMWTTPTFESLHGPFNWAAMGGGEMIGAWFIWAYTGLVACLVWAFLLSFAASVATIIYYLLRRKVDATDLDDVYVEEAPEPIAPAPASESTPAPAPEQTPPAEEPPAAQ